MSIGLGIGTSIGGKISGFGGGGSGYDPNASAYFTAASITDATEKDAANQLVLDLKGTGATTNNSDVWSDMLAFYPVSPTSLAAAAFNLKDPTAYEITWYNSPTHSSAGVDFNGTTQYGDTGLTPSVEMTAQDTSIGWQGIPDITGTMGSMSSVVSTSQRLQFRLEGTSVTGRSYKTGAADEVTASWGGAGSQFTMSYRGASDLELYENGGSIDTGLGGGTLPNLSLFFGAQNFTGSSSSYWNGIMTLGFAGNGLTDNQVTDLYDAVLKYEQTVLVGTLDAETLTFIEKAGITGRVEIAAVNQLVKDLKGTGSTTNNNNIWDSMNAIYPVSPTSLYAAAFNLKDPSAFEISWFNSPTHTATGITGNGSDMYGDTGWNVLTEGSIGDIGFTSSGEYSNNDRTMGASDSSGDNSYYEIKDTGSERQIKMGTTSTTAEAGDNTRGVFTGQRDAVSNLQGFFDGVAGTANTTAETESLPNEEVFVMARNLNGTAGGYFAGELDFWAIHEGLTANQAKDLYDSITTYNTALSR